MDIQSVLTSGLALIFVLCLLGLASILLRRYSGNLAMPAARADKRMRVLEHLNIDARKKVVLIQKDDKEYLLAFNGDNVEFLGMNDKKDS